MAYREVTMIEIREVLRQQLAGISKKRIAVQVGLDPKTVRKYLAKAETLGFCLDWNQEQITDEFLLELLEVLRPPSSRERGESWGLCHREHDFIASKLKQRVRLKKIGKLLRRRGIRIPYSTLHRYATAKLDFGRAAPTVPVVDANPGEELIVDTGWVLHLEPTDPGGRRRRKKAFIFTPSVSRYRFVYPIERETTKAAIEACEAAWQFYGGIFKNILVDNTKAIVKTPDPLEPELIPAFLEYTQARDFFVDTSRVRKPTDKARVERTVRHVRDDCFGGEVLHSVEMAREHALQWCRYEEGLRRHTRTQRFPHEHFQAVEAPVLEPAPNAPYDVPEWFTPKVGRDHLAQVLKAVYSLPTRFIGFRLEARADRCLVKFFHQGRLVKVCPRQPPGGRHFDPNDFPKEKRPYVMRDVDYLRGEAYKHGECVGKFADRVFDLPLPWARMRTVRGLLGLVDKHGAARVDEACAIALDAEMVSLKRLKKMLELAKLPEPPPKGPAKIIPFSRYARPAEQYALPGFSSGSIHKKNGD